jgi:hypothetical protein
MRLGIVKGTRLETSPFKSSNPFKPFKSSEALHALALLSRFPGLTAVGLDHWYLSRSDNSDSSLALRMTPVRAIE